MAKAISATNSLANFLKPFHHKFFYRPRLSVLSSVLAKLLPSSNNQTGLDIGCGSGELARQISLLRPQITFAGVDILERITADSYPCLDYKTYDGSHLPYADKSYSFSLLIDVLHHTDDPKLLLAEAIRVSRDFILIKDHVCESKWDNLVLIFMDWVGNKSYGVRLPFNYLDKKQWQRLFQELDLVVENKVENIGLYKAPLSLFFERKLHFIAKLKVKGGG